MPASNITLTATYIPSQLKINYSLTVESGFGGGQYSAGEEVPLIAYPPAVGMIFDRWVGATVKSPTNTNTSLIMPSYATTVSATYIAALPSTPGTPPGTTPPPTTIPGTETPTVRYKNVFNPNRGEEGEIPYTIKTAIDHVSISIVDRYGEEVFLKNNAPNSIQSHIVKWDGRNTSGEPAASGVYMAIIRFDDSFDSKIKLVIVK